MQTLNEVHDIAQAPLCRLWHRLMLDATGFSTTETSGSGSPGAVWVACTTAGPVPAMKCVMKYVPNQRTTIWCRLGSVVTCSWKGSWSTEMGLRDRGGGRPADRRSGVLEVDLEVARPGWLENETAMRRRSSG